MKIQYYVAVILAVLWVDFSTAQSVEERNNRAVFNRIEFFFNIQQADSIYHLGSERFRNQVNPEAVQQVVDYFSAFGRMHNANVVDFSQGVASYEANVGERFVRIKLAIDSNLHYDLFQIQEIPARIAQEPEEKEITPLPENADVLDRFVDSIARSYMRYEAAKSLAIGLISDNEVKTFFYGETTPGSGTLPHANTIYEIGSITKTFTATLLANLVENGTIQLDDSIAKFLPDSVASNPFIQKITFKSLANHTSGLPKLPDNIDQSPQFDRANPYAHYGRKELFAFLKTFDNENEPGDQFEYSNLGYGLLGELLSIITDVPFAQLVTDSIATPLNMTNTVQHLDAKKQQLMQPHNNKGEAVAAWQFEAMSGAGALRSTINDLLRYAHTQFLMPENTLEQAMMLTRQFSYFIPPNTDIGLAWHMNMLGDVIYYWHNGMTGGSSSYLAIAPDKSTALVVLSNAAVSVDDISQDIMRRLLVAP